MISKKEIEDEGKAQYQSWRDTRNKTNWAMTKQPSVFTGEKYDVATFIGKTSSSYNMGMESKAQEMEKAGVDPETIWNKTGTMRNYSNAWQQEIPDNEAQLTTGPASQTYAVDKDGEHVPRDPNHPEHPLMPIARTNDNVTDTEYVENGNAGVLDHPGLYNAYNGLGDAAVTYKATDNPNAFAGVTPDPKQFYEDDAEIFWNKKTNKWSSYDGIVKTHGKDYADNLTAGDMTIHGSDVWFNTFTDPNTGDVDYAAMGEELKRTMIHELQHSIQVKEGWTQGGNTESLKPFVRDMLPEAFDHKKAGFDTRDSYVNYMAYQVYKHQVGEVQSRLTENRMDLTAEERIQNYPYKQGKYGLDVDPKDIALIQKKQNKYNSKTGTK